MIARAGRWPFSRQLIFTLACSLFLFVVAHAQVAAEYKKGSLPIEVKLSTTSMMLCLGSGIPLNLELTNHGRDEIRIDKFDLWSHFSYGHDAHDGIGRGGGETSFCERCRGTYTILKPDKAFESSFTFPLEGEFFKNAGSYSIKVDIEGTYSNQVEFELYNCN